MSGKADRDQAIWPQSPCSVQSVDFRKRNGETKEVIVTKRKEEEISLWIYLPEFTMNYGWNIGSISSTLETSSIITEQTRETLTSTECFIHIYFAENYVWKMSREIQSKHFGVSQIQITLHTGYFITGTMDKVQFFLWSVIQPSTWSNVSMGTPKSHIKEDQRGTSRCWYVTIVQQRSDISI